MAVYTAGADPWAGPCAAPIRCVVLQREPQTLRASSPGMPSAVMAAANPSRSSTPT